LPKVLAWGQTLPSPPYRFYKGVQPHRRVPLALAYDGQEIDIGRVVVDSTWHHWFDMNLEGLAAAPDPSPYAKISRYHVNVAIWLALPSWRAAMTLMELKAAEFDYFGFEEIDLGGSSASLGEAALAYLAPRVGAGWVRELCHEAMRSIGGRLLPPRGWAPGPATPREVDVEANVLGGIVRELYADLPANRRQLAQSGKVKASRRLPGDPFELAVSGARRGFGDLARNWRFELKRGLDQADRLERQLAGAAESMARRSPARATPPKGRRGR
jgi:hypothetical protein